MEKIMMKPEKGQMVKSEELGITGKVVDVLTFDDVHNWMPQSQYARENARLANELGTDYKEKFFEVMLDVLLVDEEADYKPGEQAMLSWKEFQHCKITKI